MSIVYALRRFLLRNLLTLQVTVLIVAIGFGATMFWRNASGIPTTTTTATTTSTSTTTTSTTTTTTTTLSPTTTTTTTTRPATTTTAPPLVQVTGDWVTKCRAWADLAGIELPESAITLISRESKCDPNAQNPRSTAYGIGQFLDSTWKGVGCVKTSDPVEQLRCMNLYVMRHGGWDGALAHSLAKGWY